MEELLDDQQVTFIVDCPPRLTLEAARALLKVLEEATSLDPGTQDMTDLASRP